MKKKILGLSIALFITLSIGMNFRYSQKTNRLQLLLSNVEALASGEETTSEYFPSYINKNKRIRNYQGNFSLEVDADGIAPGVSITINASGNLNYCKHTRNQNDKCYKSMLGFTPFT